MKSLCEICKTYTNQKVLGDKKVYFYDDALPGWEEEHIYQIIECGGCENVSFRHLYTDSITKNHSQSEGLDPYTQILYPKRTKDTIDIKTLLNTPVNIVNIYRETIDAFNNNQTILCSGGIRAIIEGICKDKGIKSGEITDKGGKKRNSTGLEGKIEGLVSERFLTKSNAETLHDLRFMGNEALHELESPTKNELKLAIEIIESTINNIYEIAHKAVVLKQETARRKRKK